MNTSIYWQCIAAGVGGIIVQIIAKLIKLKKLKEASQGETSFAKERLTILQFFQADYLYLTLSIVVVLLFVLTMDEYIDAHIILFGNKFLLGDVIKIFFVPVGYMGAGILSFALGKTEKSIINIIDKKTNIADNTEKVK